MNLSTKVLVALILGIIIGLLINLFGSQVTWIDPYLTNGLFHVIGKLFVNALKMLVVPLVIFSLIPGIINIGDASLLGRVGAKSVALYILTTALAITLAITIASALSIGSGMQISVNNHFSGKESDQSFSDILINIIPSNPIAAMANSDMLAVIFFSLIFGLALLKVVKQSKELSAVIEQMNEVMMQMTSLVMHFAPYAVFCLVAKAIAQLGFDVLGQLLGYFLTVVFVLLLHVFITQVSLFTLLSRLNPITLLKKVRAAQLFAFSTSSSAATIPVSLRTTQQRIGVDRSVSSFCIPFGATINMDGTAIMQGVATIFIANLYAIDLSFAQHITIIVTAVLASIGTAAVPSVGLVMLTLVFNQVGLPVEGIGLILGVDRLLDMLRTAVNVTGDIVVTSIVAKSENKLNVDNFNDPEAGIINE